MHAYNRLPTSGQSSPSAPSSPPSRSPRLRSKPAPRFPGQPAPKTLPQYLSSHFLSLLLRRQGIFLVAPLIYISGILFYVDTLSFHNLPTPYDAPGSIYRSPQLYATLRPEMESDKSNADAISTIWKNSYKGGEWRPCIDKSSREPETTVFPYDRVLKVAKERS